MRTELKPVAINRRALPHLVAGAGVAPYGSRAAKRRREGTAKEWRIPVPGSCDPASTIPSAHLAEMLAALGEGDHSLRDCDPHIVLGNSLALLQNNLKRLLAYFSIFHMGYLLVGSLAGESSAEMATMFYLLAYFVTILGSFGA